jgi:hypothetical protein
MHIECRVLKLFKSKGRKLEKVAMDVDAISARASLELGFHLIGLQNKFVVYLCTDYTLPGYNHRRSKRFKIGIAK